jgi:hypothetical protein
MLLLISVFVASTDFYGAFRFLMKAWLEIFLILEEIFLEPIKVDDFWEGASKQLQIHAKLHANQTLNANSKLEVRGKIS